MKYNLRRLPKHKNTLFTRDSKKINHARENSKYQAWIENDSSLLSWRAY